jgi:ABC-type multidrug transport system permease subunit
MFNAFTLIFSNEFRLLSRDRAYLFMLFAAPVVITAVAGFSLTNMFGAASTDSYSLVLVDQDRGRVATAIAEALNREQGIKVVRASDLDAARRLVLGNARAPLALFIPSGTTASFTSGEPARIELLVDPLKHLQASAIELRVMDLSRHLTNIAREQIRQQLDDKGHKIRAQLETAGAQKRSLEETIAKYRRELRDSRNAAQQILRARLQQRLDALEAQSEAAVAESISLTHARLDLAIAERKESLARVQVYLRALQTSQAEFDRWFTQLRAAAGSRAGQIPAPPKWPAMPDRQQLAELMQPLTISIVKPQLPVPTIAQFNLTLPELPPFPHLSFDPPAINLAAIDIQVPGDLAWVQRSITPARAGVNAFDQYVPGFGVTFLLIDMLWGMSIGLMDERDWGTLRRLRVSGASTAGMLIGRLSARSVIGFVQLVVLFGFGWLLFDISLGRQPAILLLPAAAIAFAAAAFGLVIACLAPSRDTVLPIGSVAAMVMSAVGGCWWPLEFEPGWMRTLALAMPTTWTMRAFNNLMIRGLEAGAALWPATMVFGLGVIFLIAGVAGSPRLYR